MSQIHHKFKVFVGDLPADNSLGSLADEVAAFSKDKAAKSIGVEYLESAKKLVISLGYSESDAAYPVSLSSVGLGKFALSDLASLEAKMGEASSNSGSVICHELYVTDDNEFFMVFLTKK